MAKKKKARARKEKQKETKIIAPSPRPAIKTPERPATKVDFRKEYPYVYSDLKRAGITAIIMLVFMFLLSIIIH